MTTPPSLTAAGKEFLKKPSFYLFLSLFTLSLIYYPSLNGPFLLDDFTNLPLANIDSLDISSIVQVAQSNGSGLLGRPISAVSFALTSYLSGMESFYFKLHNLLLHLITTLALYFAIWQILNYFNNGKNSYNHSIAILTTICWAAHPILVSTILYSVQRMAILAGLFSLITIGLFYYAQNHWPIGERLHKKGYWLVMTLSIAVTFPLAFFSKENGLLAIILIAALQIIRFIYNRRLSNKVIYTSFYSIFILSLLLILNSNFIQNGYQNMDITVYQRMIAQTQIMAEYIYMILLPFSYSFGFFYDDIESYTQFTASTLISVTIHLALIHAALVSIRNKPLISIGIFWFYIFHSAESTLMPLELMWEHRNYLPSIGVIFIVAQIIISISDRLDSDIIKAIFVAAFPLLMLFTTQSRATHWIEGYSLAQHLVNNRPHSCRSRALMADEFSKMNRHSDAIKQIEQCIADNPTKIEYYIRLLGEQCVSTRLPETLFNQTVEHLSEQFISRQTISSMATLTNLYRANQCTAMERQQVESLIIHMIRNMERKHDKRGLPKAHVLYGRILRHHGQFKSAESHFQKALSIQGESLSTELEIAENSLLANDLERTAYLLQLISNRYDMEKHSVYLSKRYERIYIKANHDKAPLHQH